MRQLSLRRLLALVGAVVFVSACRMETTAPPFDPNAFVTAEIDGTAFRANYYVQSAIGELRGDTLIIAGLYIADNFAGREVGVVIPGFTGAGTYEIAAQGGSATYGFYYDIPDVRLTRAARDTMDTEYSTQAGAGTLLIEGYNASTKQISGTFGFVAASKKDPTDSVAVQSGAFSGLAIRTR